eukprot:CAMPEP_0172397156 /NCGR_PEP_ID=MMETSP1061-20121228/29312_1 /TAXON_ID=37318 /ORGANISM="Pseudo-nitzschia pungens, Strain cf. pungens" /LENGTH=167 /DNA_ID=CAMNT_0013129243 /DNA_START=56 /DNA_END=559 /DNA_ORIENTATION=-
MTYAKRREMEKSIEKLRVETFNRSIIGQDVELGPGAEDTSTEDSFHDDDDDDDSSLCVSFSPSNAFLLQAMEGATAKAKTDIEAAKKAGNTRNQCRDCEILPRGRRSGQAGREVPGSQNGISGAVVLARVRCRQQSRAAIPGLIHAWDRWVSDAGLVDKYRRRRKKK